MMKVETKTVIVGVDKTGKHLRQRNGKTWQPIQSKG